MMKVSEAAKVLGVTPQGVRDAIMRGTLSASMVTVTGRSPLKPIYQVNEEDVERYRREHRSTGGGWNRGYDPEETKRMEAQGYMTTTKAARLIGVNSAYITKQVQAGKIPGVRKHITFVHKDEVARLKAERDAKIEAMQ